VVNFYVMMYLSVIVSQSGIYTTEHQKGYFVFDTEAKCEGKLKEMVFNFDSSSDWELEYVGKSLEAHKLTKTGSLQTYQKYRCIKINDAVAE
jgi:hypothetical protein